MPETSYDERPTPDPTEPNPCDTAGQSDNPIAYSSGQIQLAETDLSWQGFGFSWSHRRSYANILQGGTLTPQGHGWLLNDLAYLVFVPAGDGNPDRITLVRGTRSNPWFAPDNGGWKPLYEP